jgi:two-component system, chemotaxis family, protein-glutamate methylesterase/glutaminase
MRGGRPSPAHGSRARQEVETTLVEAATPPRSACRDAVRDIVVIGASAGGLQALTLVLGQMAPPFAGSVFVVQHAARQKLLASILAKVTALPVAYAADGDPIVRGTVVLAPPDQSLLFDDGRVVLSRGPRQNNARPSIDALFRSAARVHGERVVGVVLSGMLDDGSAGLVAISRAGGCTIVQHPDDAVYGAMPANAIAALRPDYVLPAARIGGTLVQLAASNSRRPPTSRPNAREQTVVRRGESDPDVLPAGSPAHLACPECGGTLWERREGNVLRFICHIGHAYSAESMDDAQGAKAEAAMWIAFRALKERAMLLKRLAAGERRSAHPGIVSQFERRAKEYEAQAAVLQQTLLGERVAAAPTPSRRAARRRRTRK